VSATVVACLLLAGCTSEDPAPTPTASAAALGRSGVTAPDGWDGTVTITAPQASDPLLTDTRALLDAGLMVGMPLEINADQDLPAQGLTITRTYPVPLGADMAATLAFFNEDAGGWQAVPSELSSDRRTVSAVVTHLSVWNDIVSGTQQSVADFRSAAGDAVRAGSELTASALSAAGAKLADVADWMYYAVGKVFDTRVEAPVCEGDPPSWVRDVVFIEDHRNNSIRFCTGRDAKKPNLLVVKARVNRGFAFAAKPAVKTAWQYNSSETTGLWDAVLPWLKANDEALRDTLLDVTGGDPRLAVGAGQELSLGLAEKDTRAVKGSTVLELQPPDALLFLYSLLGQLIMQDLGLKDASVLTTALALSSCISSVAEADRDDPLKIAKAVLVCLQSQSETITKLTVRIMTETSRDAAATLSTARVLTRASIYLALIGPVFSTMNWVAETQTLKNARTIDVFTTVVPKRPKTEVIVLDIYDSNGKVRTKYDIDDMDGEPVDCASPSKASRGPAVFECGVVAFNGAACWKALDGSSTVLCLGTPWSTTLRRAPVLGSGVGELDSEPIPFGIELADGTRWWLRLGGAWPFTGVDTIPIYGPDSGDMDEALIQRFDEEPIIKDNGTWTVLRGPFLDSGDAPDEAVRVDIAKVWFVSGRWQ